MLPSGRPALTAEGIAWRYGSGAELFRDLSLRVAPGQLLRVHGGNGSGKSTLLWLLAGCAVPRRGRVRATGPVGYLPQLARALPPVAAGRLLGLLSGAGRSDDAVVGAHLGIRADRLSGGTARRLLLAAVLDLPAPILVLDEPTAGLDADGVVRLGDRLRQRLASGTAVVVAEHAALPLVGGEVLELGGRESPRAAGVGEVPSAQGLVEVVLGGRGEFRGAVDQGGTISLVLPAQQRDRLLAEALAAGWSVLAVRAAG